MGSLCQILREPQDPPTPGLSLHCPCACAAETRSAHPHSCSFQNRRAITAAFVSLLLLPTRHATLPPLHSRRLWSTCIRAVPSVALSSTASDQCIAHHRSWHHFSRGQHFVEHLNCIFDTATPPVLAQGLDVACFGLAVLPPRTLEPRAPLARMALPLTRLNPFCAPLFAPGRSPPFGPALALACLRRLHLCRACSGRPTPAHTANFRASLRARSCHSLGTAHVPAAPAPTLALQHASSSTA
jgi:hypothetical protein